jgi:hypothetical protein
MLLQGEGWTASGRMLMFEFSNEPKQVLLSLWLGPGPAETRERLYQRGQHPPFRPTRRKLASKWSNLWSTTFLPSSAYEVDDMADVLSEIRKQWAHFVEHDLPALTVAVSGEEWLAITHDPSALMGSTAAPGADGAVVPISDNGSNSA